MKPSAVFFIAVDLLRSLGKRFPSSASFSPASGMWAATYTNPATDGSVSSCFVPTLYDFLCECRVQVHRCTDHMGSDLDLAPVKNFEEPRQTLFVAVVVPFARWQIWILRIDLRHRAFGSAGRLCAASICIETEMTMRAPSGQKAPVPGLFSSGAGSGRVTDDGTAPAIAAIAPALIKSRREVIVLLPKALPRFEEVHDCLLSVRHGKPQGTDSRAQRQSQQRI